MKVAVNIPLPMICVNSKNCRTDFLLIHPLLCPQWTVQTKSENICIFTPIFPSTWHTSSHEAKERTVYGRKWNPLYVCIYIFIPKNTPATIQPHIRSGCPGLRPVWPWASPGLGYPQTFWVACTRASPLVYLTKKNNFILTSNLNSFLPPPLPF